MRRTVLAMTASIALIAGSASAQEVLAKGYSTGKCSDILELYRLDEEQQSGSGSDRIILFFNSFLSGINAAVVGLAETPWLSLDLASGPYASDELRAAWILSACRTEPNSPVWQHAYRFWIEGLRAKVN